MLVILTETATRHRSRHCTGYRFESISDSVGKNNPPKPPRQRPAFFLIRKLFYP